MRYFLTTNSTPGQDLRFSDDKMASSWNYINKIWNISRFIQMNLNNNNYNGEEINPDLLTSIDKWILAKLNNVVSETSENYEKFEFGEAARIIYNFIWDDFASWYVELSKVSLNNANKDIVINVCSVLKHVLITVLKLLHPFMPFVTEEIYQHFEEGSIMVSNWPTTMNLSFDQTVLKDVEKMLNIISSVRNIRAEKNVAPSKKISIGLETSNIDYQKFLNNHYDYLSRFLNFEELTINNNINHDNATIVVVSDVNVIVPLKELINFEEEKARLTKELSRLENEVKRSVNMLNNASFIAKAPAQKVEAEKAKLVEYQNQLKEVENLLKDLEMSENA
jgi:valyl-tRNA synthetase